MTSSQLLFTFFNMTKCDYVNIWRLLTKTLASSYHITFFKKFWSPQCCGKINTRTPCNIESEWFKYVFVSKFALLFLICRVCMIRFKNKSCYHELNLLAPKIIQFIPRTNITSQRKNIFRYSFFMSPCVINIFTWWFKVHYHVNFSLLRMFHKWF